MILLFNICVKHEIHEWQFSTFFMILSEKLVNFRLKFHKLRVNRNSLHRMKWYVIPWNNEKCFQAWIFHEPKYSDSKFSQFPHCALIAISLWVELVPSLLVLVSSRAKLTIHSSEGQTLGQPWSKCRQTIVWVFGKKKKVLQQL